MNILLVLPLSTQRSVGCSNGTMESTMEKRWRVEAPSCLSFLKRCSREMVVTNTGFPLPMIVSWHKLTIKGIINQLTIRVNGSGLSPPKVSCTVYTPACQPILTIYQVLSPLQQGIQIYSKICTYEGRQLCSPYKCSAAYGMF